MKDEISRIKSNYLPGMRVRLLRMDDIQAPPVGTMGTVRGVDDMGSIMVSWDNGSGLNVVPEEDEVEIVRTCPLCGKAYTGHPALSRRDDRTEICPDCGTREAIEAVREI